MNNSLIAEFLTKLGFDDKAIRLYQALVINGPQTLLGASRLAKIERTSLYRTIDDLTAKGLISQIPGYKRSMIKAADLNTLQMLVTQKDVESKFLTSSLSAFMTAVSTLQNPSSGSDVVYYHGKEGIKQQEWHITRCQEMPLRMYSNSFWYDLSGEKFALDLRNELTIKNFKIRELYSDQKYRDEEIMWRDSHNLRQDDRLRWKTKYIPEGILKIQMNLEIYDNVVSYYYWSDNQLFGVEINDARVALFHKQTFDIIWKKAK